MHSKFKYESLTNIVENVKPYRGSGNRYPWSERAYGHKDFLAVEVEGKVEYHIRYYSETILVVRDDNTVELRMGNFHQGIRQQCSGALGGFYSSVGHGGTIWVGGSSRQVTLPMFRGIRFNMITGEVHPSSQYVIERDQVDRTRSRVVWQKYADALKTATPFIKSEEDGGLKKAIINVCAKYLPLKLGQESGYLRGWLSSGERNKLERLAFDNFDTNPVEAVYLFMGASPNTYELGYNEPLDIVIRTLKRALREWVYECESVYKTITLSPTDNFVASVRSTKVLLNGKEVRRL